MYQLQGEGLVGAPEDLRKLLRWKEAGAPSVSIAGHLKGNWSPRGPRHPPFRGEAGKSRNPFSPQGSMCKEQPQWVG